EALDEPVLVELLSVLERGRLARREQPAAVEHLPPVALLPARGVTSQRLEDLGDRRLDRVTLVARVPDQREAAAGAQDPPDLGERVLGAKPVKRLRNRDGVDRPGG